MMNMLPDWVYAHKRATEKQKSLLRKWRVQFNEQTLTKRQASEIISKRLSRKPAARPLERQPETESEAWARRREEGWGPGGY